MNQHSKPQVTRQSLFAMMQAYKNTSLLKTGISLGLFSAITEPTGAAATAAAIGADERGTRILLQALAALRIVESDGDLYWLTSDTAELLNPKNPGYVGDMVHVFASDWEWDALKRFPEAVRTGGTVLDEHAETPGYAYWEDFASYAPVVAAPTAEVMTEALAPWASGLQELNVLDVACGHGVYGATIAQRFGQARLTALDWENVLPLAERQADSLGVRDRMDLISGDMFDIPLGGPYELVLITNVLHHFSETRATELLRRAASALKPGGRLGIVGFTTTDALPADDPAPYLFSVLMLAWTSEGEVHSERSYDRMLQAAGFSEAERHSVPGLPFRVLTAIRA